jgi:hypothetical protein
VGVVGRGDGGGLCAPPRGGVFQRVPREGVAELGYHLHVLGDVSVDWVHRTVCDKQLGAAVAKPILHRVSREGRWDGHDDRPEMQRRQDHLHQGRSLVQDHCHPVAGRDPQRMHGCRNPLCALAHLIEGGRLLGTIH